MGNINDGYITEASGLAYSRRSGQVDFPCFPYSINVNNTYFRPCGFTMTQAEVHSLTQSQSTVRANPYLA